MERPIFQPVGTAVEELDTPALVVDLAAMERNIETLQSKFRNGGPKVRPHVASHQCPQIAHRQLEAGGTVGGIGVTTIGEAEVFSQSGFDNILLTSAVVTKSKIRRLCSLAQRNHIGVVVDSSQNVSVLSEAATALGVTLHVSVELEAGLGRCGVADAGAARELSQAVDRSPGLLFAGLLAIPPTPNSRVGEKREAASTDQATRESETKRRLQPVLDAKVLIEGGGLNVPSVCVGGTHSYDVSGQLPGVTEVIAGSYPLMDYNYCQLRTEFTPAARILSQVISHPVANRAVVDAGHKAIGPDQGVPVLDGLPGATATRFSAEHGILELEGAACQQLQPGDKSWLVPFNLALCLNQYDYIRAVRDGRLEGFWPLAARGSFG